MYRVSPCENANLRHPSRNVLSGPGSVAGYSDWLRGSNPGVGDIFRTCPDRPWGPPSFLYNGYLVFPGGKERSGRDADPSPPFRAVVMKE